MASPVRIVGICGSLRKDSFNGALLRAAGELLPPDTTLDVASEVGSLPLYDEDLRSAGLRVPRPHRSG